MLVNVYWPKVGKVGVELDRLEGWMVESDIFMQAGIRMPGEHLRASLDCHRDGEGCPFRSHGHPPTQITVTIFKADQDDETLEAIEAASGRRFPDPESQI